MKILIIKLSAIGDVLRTTTLLHGLKRRFKTSRIVWLTSAAAVDLLKENQFIDVLLAYNRSNIRFLKDSGFDLLICLDKEIEASSLATRITARRKIGFGLDERGRLSIFNKDSEYAYRLGISDELKFRLNKKTYPEIIYEMCGLQYRRDRYILNLNASEIKAAHSKFVDLGIKHGDFVIGLNTGAGKRFANKIWPIARHELLIEEILKSKNAKIVLLGGRREKWLHQRLKVRFKDKIYDAGTSNSLREFAAIISCCNIIISGDTLAMHLGIALNKYVIAIFGPTCAQEIELYDNGKKIVSDIQCSPCYKTRCYKKDNCMSRIKLQEIVENIKI